MNSATVTCDVCRKLIPEESAPARAENGRLLCVDCIVEELRRPAQIERRKMAHKGARQWAATVWIATGLYLTLVADKFALVSLRALLFFLPGTLIVAVIFGAFQHGLNVAFLNKFYPSSRPADLSQGRPIVIFSSLNMLIAGVLVFLLGQWAARYIA